MVFTSQALVFNEDLKVPVLDGLFFFRSSGGYARRLYCSRIRLIRLYSLETPLGLEKMFSTLGLLIQ